MGDHTKDRFGYKGVMGKIDNDKKYGNNDFQSIRFIPLLKLEIEKTEFVNK